MLTIVSHLFFKSLDTTDTHTKYYSDAVLVGSLKVKTTVLYTLHGGDKCELGVTVELAGLLAVNPIIDVKVLYLASKLGFEQRRVKLCNRCGAAFTLDHGSPCLFGGVAQWGNGTKTCYYYSLKLHLFCVLLDVLHGVAYSLDGLSLVVGDIDTELLFKFHNQLNGIQRVGTQVVGEACFWSYILFLNTEFVNDNLFNFAFNF